MKKLRNKNGSVLLLSLLVTSALLASVLYINIISLRQNIQVTNIDNSLHSYHGAESGNEEVLYRLRSGNYSDPSYLSRSFSIGNVEIATEVTDELNELVTGIQKNEFFSFDIFNPDKIAEGSELSYLNLSWDDDCDNKSWIELTSNEWNMDDEKQIYWGIDSNLQHIKKSLLNKSQDEDLEHIDSVGGSLFVASKAYQFRIKALYCNISNLKIQAFDYGDTPIMFKNVYKIRSVAEYPKGSSRANKQALSVNFKRFAPLSGLFDYVIFSEESLIKDVDIQNLDLSQNENFFIASPEYLNIGTRVPYNYSIQIIGGKSPRCIITGSMPTSFRQDGCFFSLEEESPGQYLINIVAEDGENSATKQMWLIIQ